VNLRQLCERKKERTKNERYEYWMLTKKFKLFLTLIACYKSHTIRTTRRRNFSRVWSHYIGTTEARCADTSLPNTYILFHCVVHKSHNYYYYIISTRYVFNQETRDSGIIFLGNSTITYFNLISRTIVWTYLNLQCFVVEINNYIYSATRTIYIYTYILILVANSTFKRNY